jgi:hypothetical protein
MEVFEELFSEGNEEISKSESLEPMLKSANPIIMIVKRKLQLSEEGCGNKRKRRPSFFQSFA